MLDGAQQFVRRGEVAALHVHLGQQIPGRPGVSGGGTRGLEPADQHVVGDGTGSPLAQAVVVGGFQVPRIGGDGGLERLRRLGLPAEIQ